MPHTLYLRRVEDESIYRRERQYFTDAVKRLFVNIADEGEPFRLYTATPSGEPDTPIPKDWPYPCMWLLRPGEKAKMIPSKEINHSTHQNWFEDGKGWYWCSHEAHKEGKEVVFTKWGVYAYDLATGAETKVSSVPAMHAAISADRSAMTFDWVKPALQVGYQDLKTGRTTYVFSRMPDYFLKRAKCHLHADPHPQFVCRDRWIASTLIVDDGRRLTVAMTPVGQLEGK